jgi:Domain of Unknown Function (DUF928)
MRIGVLYATFFVAGCLAIAMSCPPTQAQTQAQTQAGDDQIYTPRLRGAPGGRMSGASRSGPTLAHIDLLAPDGHTGLTASPSPNLYFYVSRPVGARLRFTIRVPMRAAPLVNVELAALDDAGIHGIQTASYGVELRPGIIYTWSVSVVVDPRAPSNDLVASATIMRLPPDASIDPSAAGAALERALLLAKHGVWYDAIAAAIEGQSIDGHVTLDRLLDQVGLAEAANFDRQVARGRQ